MVCVKVLSVRVSDDLLKEIESVCWWDDLSKTETLRLLLKLGIREWKRQKGLHPDIPLDITE